MTSYNDYYYLQPTGYSCHFNLIYIILIQWKETILNNINLCGSMFLFIQHIYSLKINLNVYYT